MPPVRVAGRYAIYEELGRGGMATVCFGRLFGEAGFSRAVAIKMLRPELAGDPEFVAMFTDEARLCARVAHPNVVQTLDVVATQGELFVVMEYVHGESLARLLRAARAARQPISPAIAVAIMTGALLGLHAAHEAKSARGEPLDIVHRDVSPENILVAADGVAKVADFGVAKARGRLQKTRTGELKGKLAYMAPEQLDGRATRQSDVFAASIVLWEALAGRRLFEGADPLDAMQRMYNARIDPPGAFAEVPEALGRAVMRGLAPDPAQRFASALEMATALGAAVTPASALDVAAWVTETAGDALARRAAQLASIEHPAVEQTDEAGHGEETLHEEPEEETDAGEATRALPGLARTPARDPSGRLGWFAGALLAFGLGAGALVFFDMQEPDRAPARVENDAGARLEDATDASVDSAVVSAVPSPELSAAPVKSKPRLTRPHGGCSPPYTIGSDGLRHYKPECW